MSPQPLAKPVSKPVSHPIPITTAQSQAQAKLKPKPKLNPLEHLVRLEAEAMGAKDLLALRHMAVNRPRDVLGCGHIIWVSRDGIKRLRLETISAQDTLDRHTPFAQWLTSHLTGQMKKNNLTEPHAFLLSARRTEDAFSYPFTHATYAPFAPNPKCGGLLFTFESAPTDAQTALMVRMGQSYGLVAAALHGAKRAKMTPRKRNIVYGAALICALVALIPVPMTTLAPAEIVASEPYVMSAPIDGIVKDILVPPNSAVTAGDPIVQLDDTALLNEWRLAKQDVQLSEARRRMAELNAFVDPAAKRELAIREAEVNLSVTKREYAQARLDKTILRAPASGLALYTDVSDWTGRPVATGEAILRIAEPTRVLLRIHAPLAHGEALQEGTRVRMYLDTDPLTPREATLIHAAYRAEIQPEGGMAFTAHAAFTPNADDAQIPRIGARGVAKIYGERAPIGYWLIRRPLTILRQVTGL